MQLTKHPFHQQVMITIAYNMLDKVRCTEIHFRSDFICTKNVCPVTVH